MFLSFKKFNVSNNFPHSSFFRQCQLMAKSIIQCKAQKKDITRKINLIYNKYKNKKIINNSNLHGKPGASLKIYNILKRVNLKKLIKKKFYDQ